MHSLVVLMIYLVLIGAVAWLATWILQQFPPPDPLGRVLRVAIVVVAMAAGIFAIARAFGISL